MNAIRAYVSKAKELDLVADEADFVAALIQDLLNQHGKVTEELILSDVENSLKRFDEMAKEESGEGAA